MEEPIECRPASAERRDQNQDICAFDDWMFETLPPSIAWERTTTLGGGGDRCDFCWRRSHPTEPTSALSRKGAEVSQ